MSTRRDFITNLLGAPAMWAARSRPPNIVFILSDDLSYRDLGAYGQTRIETPNLDRLYRESMRFTQAYSGSAECAPSRRGGVDRRSKRAVVPSRTSGTADVRHRAHSAGADA